MCGNLIFRTIRSLQYTIPAVGHHYGNAFAPDGEDDDDDEDGLGSVTLGTYSQSMNVASTTDGECYDEEEEEIDVSLSKAFCFRQHWAITESIVLAGGRRNVASNRGDLDRSKL